MAHRAQLWVLGLAMAAMVGCGGKASPGEGALTSTVVIAERGTTRATFDQAWVVAHPPDVSWGQGRAWTLGRFFSDAWADPGFELRVSGTAGEAVVFTEPGSRRDGRQPMLVINQKGVPLVTLAGEDGNPDAFHGRGGARQRSGDESPRVIGVARIELLAVKGASRKKPSPGEASAPTSLTVMRDGAAAAPLTVESLAGTAGRPLMDEAGAPRGVEYWDLRAWADGQVLTAVVDRAGSVTEVAPGLWADASKTPSIRVNRRGAWRFEWISPDGAQLRDLPSVGNVAELRLRAP